MWKIVNEKYRQTKQKINMIVVNVSLLLLSICGI